MTGAGGPNGLPGPAKQGFPNIFWVIFDFFDGSYGNFSTTKNFPNPGKFSLFASMPKISTIPPVAGKITILNHCRFDLWVFTILL